jgi:hypothetical protein
MRLPQYSAQASLYRSHGHYRNGDHSAGHTDSPGVQMAWKECVDYCEPCGASGFQTCHSYAGGNCSLHSTFSIACTYCKCAFNVGALGWLNTCIKGGKTAPGGTPCSACRDFHIKLDWPAPDICLRLCIGSLTDLSTLTLTKIDCGAVPG